MDRRKFLSRSTASATYLGLGALGLNSCDFIAGEKKITILHTNDVHSHIDPFPASHTKYANLGGIARRAKLVENIRRENPNTLLFDAGDIFQGTPYFNFYGGELEFKLMSMLKYDAATIGNHDFDNGVDGLSSQMPHANFELLSANYNFVNTSMESYVKPYKIFTKEGIKIGVYGLGIKLDGLVTKKLYGETQYYDPYEIAIDVERELKEDKKCDLIICLSHLGYSYRNYNKPSDLKLAAKTFHTNLIIGGHTHTFLNKPEVRLNQNEAPVFINQVGCYGIKVGKIDFYFDKKSVVGSEGYSISI